MSHPLRLLPLLGCPLLVACSLESAPVEPPELSEAFFDCAVQPVLVRECSFPACHGSAARRMQVLAPGRMRLAGEYAAARATITADDAESGIQPPLTAHEARFNYKQALGFAYGPGEELQLLSRPLALAAGGTVHAQTIGGDVFASVDAPGYLTIEAWLAGAGADACPKAAAP